MLLLTIPEACRSAAISRSRLYEELGAGRLRAVKAGRRTLIPADELARWAESLPSAIFNQLTQEA